MIPRVTRTSTIGTRRSASAVPVSSPVQSAPKRRRKTIPSPPPESDGEDSHASIMTAVTTKSSSAVSSRAPRRGTRGRTSSTTIRQSTRRTTTRTALSTTEIQEETVTIDRLTPAPTESDTLSMARSVTPMLDKIEPATPIKHEHDSPKSASDKENQVPMLAVPSLLGSVKKGQEITPPPEYVSPRKLDVARLAAVEASNLVEGPRKRIVITHLVLINFKSYAGRQVIGPFHTVSHLP